MNCRKPPALSARPLAACLMLAATLLTGCAAKPPPPPPPTVVAMTVHLAADGNPDVTGRASPTVVRVYQLRSDDALRGFDLEALYARDKELLAADIVQREEWTLRPGESHEGRWTLSPDVHAIAVVAALRDYRAVPWRLSIPVGAPKGKAIPKAPPVRALVVEIGRDGAKLASDPPATGK